MSTKTPPPRLPAIGEFVRGHGVLVAIEVVPPPPPPPPPETSFVFEAITARSEVRLAGEVLSTFSTKWDFHGQEKSVAGAIAEAQHYAAIRHLGPQSDVEVVAIRVATQLRKNSCESANNYDESFLDFASRVGCERRGLPAPIETIMWSSKAPA